MTSNVPSRTSVPVRVTTAAIEPCVSVERPSYRNRAGSPARTLVISSGERSATMRSDSSGTTVPSPVPALMNVPTCTFFSSPIRPDSGATMRRSSISCWSCAIALCETAISPSRRVRCACSAATRDSASAADTARVVSSRCRPDRGSSHARISLSSPAQRRTRLRRRQVRPRAVSRDRPTAAAPTRDTPWLRPQPHRPPEWPRPGARGRPRTPAFPPGSAGRARRHPGRSAARRAVPSSSALRGVVESSSTRTCPLWTIWPSCKSARLMWPSTAGAMR